MISRFLKEISRLRPGGAEGIPMGKYTALTSLEMTRAVFNQLAAHDDFDKPGFVCAAW